MPTNNASNVIKDYLAYLSAHPNGEEIQYRTQFENFFNKCIPLHLKGRNITTIQEDRHSGIEIDGTPDFFVYEDYGSSKKLVGFIECKKPNFKLEKLIDSSQIKKYAKTCENIIITNYHRFILLQKGKIAQDIELSNEQYSIQKFENLLRDFYSYNYPYIKTKKSLVFVLATQSFYYSIALREFMTPKNEAKNFYIRFTTLFHEYQKTTNYSYELADFCDIYSQSLVYGLILACIDTNKNLNEKELNYLQDIPNEYTLLKEFLSRAYEIYDLPISIKIALINIGKNINLISIEDIKEEFAETNSSKQNIAVYLYEDFLKEYDKLRGTENRKENGVYYTPSEVTNFITRNVNEIIKKRFSLPLGYLSPNVKILDFACGTGTFLHSIFEQIIKNDRDDLYKEDVTKKIKEDIYGFELLFTPYIVAHTTLVNFLEKNGIKLNDKLRIYLTNTLDTRKQEAISGFMTELKKEYETSLKIKKEESILAIVGNPPYFNGKSKANKSEIDDKLKDYKDGLSTKNKKIKLNLDDMYIKFIRFAELKVEECGYGIIGIITNNSYLYGKNHRQMRKHLYETFDEIFILNLHGDMDRKENDQNVFDIKRGVCITFFIKYKKKQKKKVSYFSSINNKINLRLEKLDFLKTAKISNIKWEELNPAETENYWFTKKDFSEKNIYDNFWKLPDIFESIQSCVKTDRDKLVVNYDKAELEKNMRIAFSGNYSKEFIKKYNITNSSSYDFVKKLEEQNFNKNAIIDYIYRPFDIRKIYYKIGFTSRPAKDVAKHFIEYDNIGLVFKKQLNRNIFNTVIIVDKIPDVAILETSHGNAFFTPLYRYEIHLATLTKKANFTSKFDDFLQDLNFKPTPEEILAYIYAVLHSSTYREKYLELLKIDFPAVPFARNRNIFEKYAKIGQKLINLHLLKNLPDDKEIKVNNVPKINFIIESINCDNNNLFLYTNTKQNIKFSHVTSKIYDFEIGSYKPIDKWLTERIKDNVILEAEDLKHLKKMIVAIKNTIAIMKEIEGLGEGYLG
jgi:predicted helicase